MAVIASDQFTGADATALTAHPMNVGGPWITHPTAGAQWQIRTNRACAASTSTSAMQAITGTVAGPLAVDFDVFVVTVAGSVGLLTRLDASVFTAYFVRWNLATNTWEFFETVNTVSASLGTWADTATVGASRSARVEISDAFKRLYVGGVLRIENTTHNNITADGLVGVRASAASPTVGGHIDNLVVEDLVLVPTNTVAPVVSGTRVVGSTLTSTTGTWNGDPDDFSYDWQRDGVSTGATDQNTYISQAADIGHEVTCVVTASNETGDSDPAESNGLTIVAEAVAGDMKWYVSAGSGIGGSPGAEITAAAMVFDPVTNQQALSGSVEYRLIYLKNTHAVRSSTSTKVYISQQTSSPTTSIDIGLAPESAGSDGTAVANEGTAPANVTFSAAANLGAALNAGTLTAGQHKGIWLRRTVLANTTPVGTDTAQLTHDETFA